MRKSFFAMAVVVAVLAFAAVPAFAGGTHTVTMTDHQHGSWVETGDTNPLTGDSIDVNFTGNQVSHVTYFPAGDEVWATFTETGSVWFVDSGNGVTYSGHATVWGGFGLNQRNSTTGFTMTIHVTGSDGTTLWAHEVTRMTLNANGVITVNFDKLSLTT